MLFRKRKVSPRQAARTPAEAAPPAESPTLRAVPSDPATAPAIAERPPERITAGAREAEAGGVLTIDCDAIIRNWRALAGHTAPAECSAVVKADAYGCGLEQVANALADSGCRTFFVAHLGEARRLRAAVPSATIYVLNGIAPSAAPAYAELNARPVIGSLAELAEWDAFCGVHHWRGGAALHVDTGMNRLGLSVDEAVALAPRVNAPDHGITLIMSHLANAEEPDHALNDKQLHLFRELRLMFRGIPASLANSSGIFLGAAAHFDLVRPGVALYGSNPTPGADNPMRPVIELQGRIVQVRTVPRGETVGYGATWTARRDTRIAVVSVGYGDGYPRPLGWSDAVQGGWAIVARRRCPVVGRISMDLLAIDITDLSATDLSARVHRGDFATLIGRGIDIDEFAKWGRTISYDVLTRLGQRYHRVWKR